MNEIKLMKPQGLTKKRRLYWGWYIGIPFFVLLSYCALLSSKELAWPLIHLEATLAVFGLVALCFKGFTTIVLPQENQEFQKNQEIPGTQKIREIPGTQKIREIPKAPKFISSNFPSSLLKTLALQAFFILATLVFFYILVHQAKIGLRIRPLAYGRFIEILQKHPWSLGFFPWLIYAVLGVGIGYFSCNYNRAGSLDYAMFERTHCQPQQFLQIVFQVMARFLLQMLTIILLSLGLIWFAESINLSVSFPSLFEYPLHTFFMFSLGALVFRTQNLRIINFMTRNKMSLGSVFIAYIMSFSVCILLMQMAFHIFDFGKQVFGPHAQGFSDLSIILIPSSEIETLRLTLLIWGWWALFIPLMSSVIARLSMGKRIFEALLSALLLPGLLFLYVIPNLPFDVSSDRFNNLFFSYFTLPLYGHWCIALFILLVLKMIWGKTYNTGEILLQAMPPHPKVKRRPIKNWLRMNIISALSFLLGFFLLGWLQVQMAVTLAGFSVLTIILAFVVCLWIDLFRSKKESKICAQSVAQ